MMLPHLLHGYPSISTKNKNISLAIYELQTESKLHCW